MKKSYLLILHFIFVMNSLCGSSWAIEDGIIAIVNEDVITLQDFKDYLNAAYIQMKLEGRSPSQIQNIMSQLEMNGIHQLIEDKLIISDAKKRGLELREEAISKKMEEIKAKYPSEQDFLNALLADGATITDLKNKIRDQLQVNYAIETEVKSKIFINPQEVTDYYKEHFENYQKKERVHLESIFVSKSRDPELAKIKITQALNLIKKGKDFEKVAKQLSEAPSIGIIEKGQMLPLIENVIFKLKEGNSSDIIEIEKGFYLFKVKKKLPEEIASLEETKDEIYNILYREKFKKRFRDWLEKLKKNAFIEIKN